MGSNASSTGVFQLPDVGATATGPGDMEVEVEEQADGTCLVCMMVREMKLRYASRTLRVCCYALFVFLEVRFVRMECAFCTQSYLHASLRSQPWLFLEFGTSFA